MSRHIHLYLVSSRRRKAGNGDAQPRQKRGLISLAQDHRKGSVGQQSVPIPRESPILMSTGGGVTVLCVVVVGRDVTPRLREHERKPNPKSLSTVDIKELTSTLATCFSMIQSRIIPPWQLIAIPAPTPADPAENVLPVTSRSTYVPV